MAKMKIKLLDENNRTVARTIIINGKWLGVDYEENWYDSFEAAFNYEFCDDFKGAHFYIMLQESIEREYSEIMESYEEGEEEYLFYV